MIVLASKSAVRAKLLHDAGVPFETQGSGVDEAPIKVNMSAAGASVKDIAMALAEAKALAVSRLRPDDHVIGADQILELDGQAFDKPETMEAARDRIAALSGKRHVLQTAVAVAHGMQIVFRNSAAPEMTVRDLGGSAIEAYLVEAGEAVLSSVGAYKYEGLGSRLMAQVTGADDAIYGLPRLALLEFLRAEGLLAY